MTKPSRQTSAIVRRVALLQACLIALVTLLTVVSVVTFRSLDEEVQQSQLRLLDLETLSAKISEAQSSLRGYALVGQEAFLEPYRADIPSLHDLVATLSLIHI